MPRRNHHWDYHGADPYVARWRTCTVCGLAGRTYGVGAGRVWEYIDTQDRRFLGRHRPSCPGPQVPEGRRDHR